MFSIEIWNYNSLSHVVQNMQNLEAQRYKRTQLNHNQKQWENFDVGKTIETIHQSGV